MKIGLVLDDTLDKPDGVQQYILTVGRWLTSRGHDVHYLVTDTVRTDIPQVHNLGGFVSTSFNGNRVRTPRPASRRRIRALLDELRLDVLHVQMPYSPLMAGRVIAAAGPHVAVVGTFHILPATQAHVLANRLLRMALWATIARFDRVMAVSEPAAKFARSAYGLDAVVVPNAVDTARFVAAARTNPRPSGAPLQVVFLGRLVPRKGILELLRAYAALPPEVAARAELVVGGSGPLEARARRLATGHAVRFAGFVPETDKAAFLAAADIAVFPSTGGESFGIILVEAMAAGAGAVLGGDNPGYASVLGEGSESLFDPNDTPALTRRLVKYITSEQERASLHAAQQILMKNFDVEIVGRQILSVYEHAVTPAVLSVKI